MYLKKFNYLCNVNRIYLCVLSEVSEQTLKLYICSVYILEIYIPVILTHPVIVQVIILLLVRQVLIYTR